MIAEPLKRRPMCDHVPLIALVYVMASPAMAQSISGTATFQERMALPASALFEATFDGGR